MTQVQNSVQVSLKDVLKAHKALGPWITARLWALAQRPQPQTHLQTEIDLGLRHQQPVSSRFQAQSTLLFLIKSYSYVFYKLPTVFMGLNFNHNIQSESYSSPQCPLCSSATKTNSVCFVGLLHIFPSSYSLDYSHSSPDQIVYVLNLI